MKKADDVRENVHEVRVLDYICVSAAMLHAGRQILVVQGYAQHSNVCELTSQFL